MPRFLITYAFDIPCYYDFSIEAKTAEEAMTKANAALAAGAFAQVPGDMCFENQSGERVILAASDQPIPEDEEGAYPDITEVENIDLTKL